MGDVPLFVSVRRLDRQQKVHPPADTDWALDSGGFTELETYGRWETTPQQYVAKVRRYYDMIGRMDWAAPQDWMCEPHMLEKTGLSVRMHQLNTTRNYLDLKTLWPDGPFIPVLQGWEPDDYMRHVESYEAAGIDLEAEPVVGLGSVCRRQATQEIADLVRELQPFRLHGFGMKTGAIKNVGHLLHSADSMAWSLGGRRRGPCVHLKSRCANHLHWALGWYEGLDNLVEFD